MGEFRIYLMNYRAKLLKNKKNRIYDKKQRNLRLDSIIFIK